MLYPQLNKVILIGYVKDEPDCSKNQNGDLVLYFDLIVQSTEPSDDCNHHTQIMLHSIRVKATGWQAKRMAKCIHKGAGVYIEGQLHQGPNSAKQYLEVKVTDFNLIIQKRWNMLKSSNAA